MSRPDFDRGIPRAELKRDDSLEALQTSYGNFAGSVLLQLKEMDSAAPDDILTIGENWYQLVESRDYPNSDLEREMQQQGAEFFCDMWPIFERSPQHDLRALLKQIQVGVSEGSLDERILERMAVLDLTSVAVPVREDDFLQPVDTPWGVNGQLRGNETLIYHITSGYARQYVEDLQGKPGDDVSSAVYWRSSNIQE